jgi:hypothetical protein
MQKFILNFAEDQDQKNIYNLIVKAIDLSPQELEQVQTYLLKNGFDVYAYPSDTVEARFRHEWKMVSDTCGELMDNGWVWRNYERIEF